MAACLTGGGTMGARWSSPALAMPAKTGQEKTEAAQQARGAVPGQGGGENAGGGGNSPVAAQRSGAEFDLHGTEERQRQAQAGDKFAVGEQSPPQNSLQNEYDAGCQGGDHPGMLHGESGPQRLLLGSSSGGRRPEGLSFPLERDQLCLQVPSLWSSPFSTIYNQAIQARGGIPPRERAQSNHIYRRYADTRRLSGTMQRVSPSGERSFQGSRRDYKRRKVVVSPGTDDRVLRLLYRLAYDDADGAGEQDQEPQESYSSFVTPPRRISPGAGFGTGQAERYGGRPLSSEGTHYSYSLAQTLSPQPWPGLGSPHNDDRGSNTRPQVVATERFSTQRASDQPPENGPTSSYGRVGLRMGSLGQDTRGSAEELGRGVFLRPSPKAHQLQGATGGTLLSTQLTHTSQGQDSGLGSGQHYGAALHKQHGGTQAGAGDPGGKDLRLYAGESHNARESPCPRGDESPSGCRISEKQDDSPLRLSAGSLPLQEGGQSRVLRSSHDRRFCNLPGQTTSSVRSMGAPARCDVGGLSLSVVGGGERLGQPPVQPFESVASQGKAGENNSNSGGPTMDGATVVPVTGVDVNSSPSSSTQLSGNVSASDAKEKSSAEVGDSRVEGLRKALREAGHDDSTIDSLVASWEASTIKNYEVYWRQFTSFSQDKGKDPFARDELGLTAFLGQLVVGDAQAKEGTIEKVRTVVKSTWDLIENPQLIAYRLQKAAAKLNGAKGSDISQYIWDVQYIWQMVEDQDIDEIGSLRDLTINAVLKLKGTLGWRGADLKGLYFGEGLSFREEHSSTRSGIWVRHWDAKTRKAKWSEAVFFPKLSKKFKNFCVVRVIQAMEALLKAEGVNAVQLPHSTKCGIPFFVAQVYGKHQGKKRTKSLGEMQADTINAYFRDNFLAAVFDDDGKSKLAATWGPHSARHAVDSALLDYGVPIAQLVPHVGHSEATITSTYKKIVRRHWDLPQECLDRQTFLTAKLLIPHVHWLTTEESKSGKCACASLLE